LDVNILFIGDVMGSPGRNILARRLPEIVAAEEIDFVVVNGENAAGGFGITPKIAKEMFDLGVHAITTGNHVWDKKEVMEYISGEPRLLRPANYPSTAPGFGSYVIERDGYPKMGVLNLMGRVFMPTLDCPFRLGRRLVAELRKQTPLVLVDMHAEATSEKCAMGWFLDGSATAVIGTHTHIQTADEAILPGGTAYITDAGMTGPYQSVIGINREMALRRFTEQLPARFEVAGGPCWICGVVVCADPETGRAQSIHRLQIKDPQDPVC
jgi:2',3'-cyclic-nucleotide 2'-phosphodiesterase